jgi:hypothetical protein
MFWIESEGELKPLPPAVFEVALGEVLDAREYQLVQEKQNEFRIRVEPLPGRNIDHERASRIIQEQVKEYGLDGRLKVEVEVVDKLKPEGGDKFKRVVSKVDEKDANKNGRNKKSKSRVGARSASKGSG